MRRVIVLLVAGAAIVVVAWLALGRPLGGGTVTKADIEAKVSKLPRGRVQFTLCNEFVDPAQPESGSARTWTCDTYIGPSKAEAQNGPSYTVVVDGDSIRSIRRAPVQ